MTHKLIPSSILQNQHQTDEFKTLRHITHCIPVTSYGDIYLGQHLLRYGMLPGDAIIYMKAISERVLKLPNEKPCLVMLIRPILKISSNMSNHFRYKFRMDSNTHIMMPWNMKMVSFRLVLLWYIWFRVDFFYLFIHIFQGCSLAWLPQCQWTNP